MSRHTVLLVGFLAMARFTEAQQVLMDRGVRAAGLWCFPLSTSETEYVYLPSSVRLSEAPDGSPEFSFIRYVVNESAEAEAPGATITTAGGGGVLHFLVSLETSPDLVSRAQTELARITDGEEVVLRGPIVFRDGRYSLVSSILTGDGGTEKRVLATGRAPVLEGNRLAFSFDLDPEKASLLLESFRMATPDVSLVFDMSFTGLSEAYDAELSIDWSEVRRSQSFGAGGTVYYVSADVEAMFEELRRNHAIELRSSGNDASMESLLQTVYSKLLELMFRPVEPERVPAGERGDLLDALGALTHAKSGPLSSRQTTGFGAYVGYQLKDIRSEGRSVLDFDHRASVERHSFVTFNLGDLYARFGDDPRFFRAVNLSDPTYLQREIHVAMDGALAPEFDRYINSVTVTLRKRHANGELTVRELVVDPKTLESGRDLRMVYGWNGDEDRIGWLEYDYRTHWSFKGGGSYQSAWVTTDAPMIDLFTPYERRSVQLLGNDDTLTERGVRAVVVEASYPFFGETRREQTVFRPGNGAEERLDITLPLGELDYHYALTWILEGGQRLTASGIDASGVVFVDEIPES